MFVRLDELQIDAVLLSAGPCVVSARILPHVPRVALARLAVVNFGENHLAVVFVEEDVPVVFRAVVGIFLVKRERTAVQQAVARVERLLPEVFLLVGRNTHQTVDLDRSPARYATRVHRGSAFQCGGGIECRSSQIGRSVCVGEQPVVDDIVHLVENELVDGLLGRAFRIELFGRIGKLLRFQDQRHASVTLDHVEIGECPEEAGLGRAGRPDGFVDRCGLHLFDKYVQFTDGRITPPVPVAAADVQPMGFGCLGPCAGRFVGEAGRIHAVEPVLRRAVGHLVEKAHFGIALQQVVVDQYRIVPQHVVRDDVQRLFVQNARAGAQTAEYRNQYDMDFFHGCSGIKGKCSGRS